MPTPVTVNLIMCVSQFRLFHPDDIQCKRRIGLWPDDESPLGEEWEGVFLEKVPCDVWQDLRHERPVLVRKFEERADKVPLPRAILPMYELNMSRNHAIPRNTFTHCQKICTLLCVFAFTVLCMLGDADFLVQMGTGSSSGPWVFPSNARRREVLCC